MATRRFTIVGQSYFIIIAIAATLPSQTWTYWRGVQKGLLYWNLLSRLCVSINTYSPLIGGTWSTQHRPMLAGKAGLNKAVPQVKCINTVYTWASDLDQSTCHQYMYLPILVFVLFIQRFIKCYKMLLGLMWLEEHDQQLKTIRTE